MRLLLISNGQSPGLPYLGHAAEAFAWLLGGFPAARVAFVPYAAVTKTYDDFVEQVRPAFAAHGATVTGVHTAADPRSVVHDADVVAVGGGNTWRLLRAIHDHGLDEAIRSRVAQGGRYTGWSAGANVACPTIRTTNDMPITDPLGMHALGLVPFQINPHYVDEVPEGFTGETREQRLTEFVTVNPDVTVVGLREGTMLRVTEDGAVLHGEAPARLFHHGSAARDVSPGSRVDIGP